MEHGDHAPTRMEQAPGLTTFIAIRDFLARCGAMPKSPPSPARLENRSFSIPMQKNEEINRILLLFYQLLTLTTGKRPPSHFHLYIP
jgi:hypothetical protein